jgi:ubiquinone/menaquinone biosynthesis C-methylase UbiE
MSVGYDVRYPTMTVIRDFTQPDTAPDYFIDFLKFLDSSENTKNLRVEYDKRMNLTPGQKILDLGCGIGGATFPIAEVVGSTGLVAGLDVSSALVEVARRRARDQPGIEFRVGDACAIPYPDEFFDAARSERVFLYLPDRLGAIAEMRRVVKRGGRIFLIDTDFDCTAIYSTKPALTRKMTSIVAASMPNANSGRELPALAKHAGLKNIKSETFSNTTPYEFMLRVMMSSLLAAVESGMVSHAEVEEWLNEQAARQANGEFFHAWLLVFVSATV